MYITFYLTTSLHHQGSKVETLEDVLAGPETEVMDAIQVATTAFVVVSPVKTVKNGSGLGKTPPPHPPRMEKSPHFPVFFGGPLQRRRQ